MLAHFKTIFLHTSLIAFLLTPSPARAGETQPNVPWPMSSAIQTETGQHIPAGARGVVLINAPREAALLQLRGIAGSGIVVLRSVNSHDCLTLPVRFVGGDFGGHTISTRSAQPIRLTLQSTRVAQALADGDDIVSDMYHISSVKDDPDADIIIQTGLSESFGFVLNPGSSIFADIVGVRMSHTTCSKL